MATYTFKDKVTGEIFEYQFPISQYDEFVKKHPKLERYFDEAPAFSYSGTGDGVAKGLKTDNTWKEVLQKISEQNPRSPLADQHLRKDSKRIKVDQTIEKHRKIQNDKKKSRSG